MKKITALLAIVFFSLPAFAVIMNGQECNMSETTSVTQEAQEVAIIAKCYQYFPRTIVLRKGSPARLYFTSVDRPHDIKIEGLQIRQEVGPGKIAVLDFTPQTAGTFEYTCDIYCGPGHRRMKGKIIVVEK
ncbi:cupredoxin domain-containing protein [Candidatus Saganbacteria bacterium]|nr:cupredoxin domain-containing protein [Candidatus Saganbacteria bacterium]